MHLFLRQLRFNSHKLMLPQTAARLPKLCLIKLEIDFDQTKLDSLTGLLAFYFNYKKKKIFLGIEPGVGFKSTYSRNLHY